MVNAYSAVMLFGVITGALATPVARTPADVLNAIATVSTGTTNLDNLITAYPLTGGTLLAALNIHNAADDLVDILIAATAVANAEGPVASPDADAILAAILAVEPTIHHALDQIILKEAAFIALPVGGIPALVLSDLVTLKANTGTFADSLINNAPLPPSTIRADGLAYKTRVLDHFDVAIAAYT